MQNNNNNNNNKTTLKKLSRVMRESATSFNKTGEDSHPESKSSHLEKYMEGVKKLFFGEREREGEGPSNLSIIVRI